MTDLLTDRFGEALVLRAHRANLLAVASLVLDYGGDEDQAIAALLHDVVEDQGGASLAAETRARFNDRIADIVLACTETDVVPKPPWRDRKEAYIASIASKHQDAILVTMADKVHNATAIVEDRREIGEEIWTRFTGRRDGTLWYYRSLADALARRRPGPLADRLQRVVAQLESSAADWP